MYNSGIQLDAPFGGSSGGMGSKANGIAGIAGGLANIFGGGGENPYDAAGDIYKQIPGMANKGLQPYAQAGQSVLGPLQQQIMQMLSDPVGLMKMFGQGYQQSPGYQFNVDQATKAGNQAAAAGGMSGTPAAQQELMKVISGLANQDYGNYMHDILGLYGQGLNSGQGFANMGQQSATNMAQIIAQAMAGQAQMGAASTNWENQNSPWNSVGQIAGGAASLFGL